MEEKTGAISLNDFKRLLPKTPQIERRAMAAPSEPVEVEGGGEGGGGREGGRRREGEGRKEGRERGGRREGGEKGGGRGEGERM